MADYQKAYATLFNAMTDAIEILQKAQQASEELFMEADQQKLAKLEKLDLKDDEGELIT